MAFPTIHGVVTTDTPLTTNPQVNLPTGMVTNGTSLVFVFFANGASEAPAGDLSAWTVISPHTNTGHRSGLVKVVDGTEGATLALGGGTNTRIGAVAFEVRGWYGGTLGDAVKWATAAYTGTVSSPLDAPLLDPDTWGTEDTLWLSVLLCDSINTLAAAPNGPTGSDVWNEVGSVWTPESSSGCASVYTRNAAAESVDPGSWSLGGQRHTRIYTVAIRPAAIALTKKIKVPAHPSAAGATGVKGKVLTSDMSSAGTVVGVFSGKAFESLTEGSGLLERAILKVPVADFGGSALAVNSTVYACVENATLTTGLIPATVIEE